eukprot:68857_1
MRVWICILFIGEAFCKPCNVLQYGAIGDGITDDTKAIQSAINNCNTILFPSSYNFLSYPFIITNNNTELVINSIVTASSSNYSWPRDSNGKYVDFITTEPNLNNITLSGTGSINGNGQYWWHPNNITYLRPILIFISSAINVNISYLTLVNSPMYHIYVGQCVDVVIHGINIISPNASIAPNTDGIDIASKNVHVYNCSVINGDDSYSIFPGAQNVLIENCSAQYGLGLCSWDGPINNHSAGNWGTMNNVTFKNILVHQTMWGIRLRTYSFFNGSVTNFKFVNITMNMVENAIDINQFNQSNYALSWTSFNNISFAGISGTYTKWAGHLDCSEFDPCSGLNFQNIYLTGVGKNVQGFSCSRNVYGNAVNVTPPLKCLNMRE